MSITDMTAEAKAASAAAVLAANGGKSTSTDDSGQINKDFTFFLKMLTTQLQNQDPSAPMDVSQMTQQIAQYSGVEQQIKTNKQLDALINSNKQSQMSTAVGYIGKEIETAGDTGTLSYASDGTQQGMAQFDYTLPDGVKNVEVKVLDASGTVVYTGAGTTTAGKNTIGWNGMNSTTGKLMDEGKYTIQVSAKDASGNNVTGITTGGEASLAHSPTQYGQAVFSYMVPAGIQSTKITILNADGGAVFSGTGTVKNGRNVVVWDGVNSFTGEQMTAGKYKIQVTGKDAEGKDVAMDARSVGVVDTVETDSNGDLLLNVGDVQVKYSDILAVREPTPFYTGS